VTLVQTPWRFYRGPLGISISRQQPKYRHNQPLASPVYLRGPTGKVVKMAARVKPTSLWISVSNPARADDCRRALIIGAASSEPPTPEAAGWLVWPDAIIRGQSFCGGLSPFAWATYLAFGVPRAIAARQHAAHRLLRPNQHPHVVSRRQRTIC
jgi:hypothetical protein